MEYHEDFALCWAERLQREYDLPPGGAGLTDLERVCADRGIEVFYRPRLKAEGLYIGFPYPVILLRDDASAFILAHELAHHLCAEFSGEDEPAYVYHPDPHSPEEQAAHRFARALCG